MSWGWPLFWFASTGLCAVVSAWFFLLAWTTEDRLLGCMSGVTFACLFFFALVNLWRLL